MADQGDEMDRLYAQYTNDSDVAHLEAIFHLIDKDNSGEISKQEAADMLRPLVGSNVESVAAQYITDVDKDGDHKISLAEFIAHMTGQSAN